MLALRRALALGLAGASLAGAQGAAAQTPDSGPPRPGAGSSGAVEVGGEQRAGYGTANPLVVENPICARQLPRELRRNCRVTGTPEGRFPTSNYALDVHIDTGLDNIVGNFQSLLAQVANAIWMSLLFVANLVITLLGWALELSPFTDNQTIGEISAALGRFYRAFTSPWLVAAMVIVGAVGAWRGLVRRDAAGAIAGALASAGLIVCSLWVIHDPQGSVGRLASLSNQAAESVIGAPQGGGGSGPGAYAQATAEVWRAMTLPGFAALNFSNVDWALSEPDGELLAKADETACLDFAYLRSLSPAQIRRLFASAPDELSCRDVAAVAPAPRTNAEIWLRSSPASAARESLWDSFADTHPYSTYFALQGDGGAWTRLPLVVLIGLGLLGAIALLAWLSLRIFVQTAVAFVLVLTTPLALFLAVFGEAGRRAFSYWATTLLGSLVAKLIYAAILSVVLLATTVVGSLVRGGGGVGALMAFLIMAALWWAVFLKREQLIAAISLSDRGEGGSGRLEGLTGLYASMRIGRALTRPLGSLAAGGAAGALGAARARSGTAAAGDRSEGLRRVASSQIARRAEARLDARYAQESAIADRQAARRRELSRLAARRRSSGAEPEASTPAQLRDLAEREGRLREEVLAGSTRAAEAARFVASADERERRSGSRWSAAELAQTRELIRREADRPIESGVHAWRVGMEPGRYEALSGRERVEAQRLVARELREDRVALGAIPDRPEGVLDRGGARAYRRELVGADGREARARLRSETTRARRERLHAERRRHPRRGSWQRGVSR